MKVSVGDSFSVVSEQFIPNYNTEHVILNYHDKQIFCFIVQEIKHLLNKSVDPVVLQHLLTLQT